MICCRVQKLTKAHSQSKKLCMEMARHAHTIKCAFRRWLSFRSCRLEAVVGCFSATVESTDCFAKTGHLTLVGTMLTALLPFSESWWHSEQLTQHSMTRSRRGRIPRRCWASQITFKAVSWEHGCLKMAINPVPLKTILTKKLKKTFEVGGLLHIGALHMKYLRLLVVLCRSALLYPPSSMAEKAVTGFSSLSHQAFKLREAVSEVFLSHKKLMRLHFSHLFTLFLNGSILEIVQVILLLDRFSGLEKKPASPNKAAS